MALSVAALEIMETGIIESQIDKQYKIVKIIFKTRLFSKFGC